MLILGKFYYILYLNYSERFDIMKEKPAERGIFNDDPDLIRKCETCAFAISLSYSGDCLCSKFGAVEPEYICKHYKINRFLRRPPKKRELNMSRYSAEDFSIE